MVKNQRKRKIGIIRMKDFEDEFSRINKYEEIRGRTCGILKINDEIRRGICG
jgi:hypothetical protein